MTDIATLGLEIRSDGVVVASNRLRQLTADGKSAENATSKLSSATSALSGYLKAAAAAFGLWKLSEYAKEAALLSARYQTLGVVMNTVGATAGYTNKQMAEFEKSLQRQGIAMVESRQVLTQMAQAQLNLAKSSELARVAQDAATIGGINSSEAFERMVSGIQKGETEILKTIGINVNFEQSYNKLALTIGKSRDALTEAEKSQARMNVVLERGKDIAGVYDAAMGTAGKQLTSVKRYVDDLKVSFGSVFSDALIVGVQAVTGGLKELQTEADKLAQQKKFDEWGRDIVMTMAAIADGVRLVYNVMQTLVTTGVAGLQQLYYGAKAFLQVISGDFAGAKDSFRELLNVGVAWADIVSSQWDGPIDKFQQAATAMYAARDANKALEEQKNKQLEIAQTAAGGRSREAQAAEELSLLVKKNQDSWGKVVVTQLESVGLYEEAAQKSIELNRLTDDYKAMQGAAAKSQEAAGALRAQELTDQQKILEAKGKSLSLENDHLAVMQQIEAARLLAMGIDSEAIAAVTAITSARLEEKKLLDQIATEINPIRKRQLAEQLDGQRALNVLLVAETAERNKIRLINDQFAIIQQQIDLAKQLGFEQEAFEQQRILDLQRLKMDYHQKMIQYQRELNVATGEESRIIRRNMELYQQLAASSQQAIENRQYQIQQSVASTRQQSSSGGAVLPSNDLAYYAGKEKMNTTGMISGYGKAYNSLIDRANQAQAMGMVFDLLRKQRQKESEEKAAQEKALIEAARVASEAAEAEQKRIAAIAATTAALNADLDVRDLINKGMEDEATILKLVQQQQAELLKYQEQGVDVSRLQITQQAELNKLIQQRTMARFIQDTKTLFSTINDGLNSISGSTRNLVSALQSASSNLKSAASSLLLTDDSLSPEQLYRNTRQQLLAVAQQAITTGNADMMNQLPGLVSSFLSASRGYYGSSSAYQSDFLTAQGILSDAGAAADIFAKAMTPVQTATDKQVELLKQLNDALVAGNISMVKDLTAAANTNSDVLTKAVNNVRTTTGQVVEVINGTGGTNQWLTTLSSDTIGVSGAVNNINTAGIITATDKATTAVGATTTAVKSIDTAGIITAAGGTTAAVAGTTSAIGTLDATTANYGETTANAVTNAGGTTVLAVNSATGAISNSTNATTGALGTLNATTVSGLSAVNNSVTGTTGAVGTLNATTGSALGASGSVVAALTGPTSVLSGLTGSSGSVKEALAGSSSNSVTSWLDSVAAVTNSTRVEMQNLWDLLNNKNWSPSINITQAPITVNVTATGTTSSSNTSGGGTTTQPAAPAPAPVDKYSTGYRVIGYSGLTSTKWRRERDDYDFYLPNPTPKLPIDSWQATSPAPGYYAKGGNYPGGSAIMGEMGPELVDSSPGYVYRADETKALFEMARRGVAKSADNYDMRELIAEVKQLRQENALIVEELREIKSPLRRAVSGR